MRDNHKKTEPPQMILGGWKDIANYLGKGVRTVQRYERNLGLPVRRPAGKPWGSVVATKAELDAWVRSSPMRGAFHLVTPAPDPPASTVAAIQNGVAEMSRLRDQVVALQDEMRTSVRLLNASIQDLRESLNHHHSRATAPVTVLDRRSPTKGMFDLLATDTRQRKAD